MPLSPLLLFPVPLSLVFVSLRPLVVLLFPSEHATRKKEEKREKKRRKRIETNSPILLDFFAYHKIVFKGFYIPKKFFDRVLLLVERKEFRNFGVQTVHMFKHILKNFVRFTGFLRKRLRVDYAIVKENRYIRIQCLFDRRQFDYRSKR